jgi:aminomethyltransferase
VHHRAEIELVSDTYKIPSETAEVQALPLDAWHRAQGARMVEFAGYHMPIQYEGIIAEHIWTRESAGLFDVSHMGQLLLSGDGLDTAVEAVLPVDLSTLQLGMQRYSLLLDENGGVLDDLMISRWPDKVYLVVNGATKWDDIGHLRENLPDEITLNHLEDQALLALQGPKAAAALERHVTGEWPLSALTFMRFGHFEIGGVPAAISRSGYTGEDGFEISVSAADAERVATLLCGEPEVWARAIRCDSRRGCRFTDMIFRPKPAQSKPGCCSELVSAAALKAAFLALTASCARSPMARNGIGSVS